MIRNISLSNGRVVVLTKEPNGSTLATPTPGDYAFSSEELREYQAITANMKLNKEKYPKTVNLWSC